METSRFRNSWRWIWSSSSRKSWWNCRRPRIYLVWDISTNNEFTWNTHIDIFLSHESWSACLRWLPWNLIGTRVLEALLPYMIHWVHTYACQLSNLLWMNLKHKHLCNKTTCLISEFVDASGDGNDARPAGQEIRRKEWSVDIRRVHSHWYGFVEAVWLCSAIPPRHWSKPSFLDLIDVLLAMQETFQA